MANLQPGEQRNIIQKVPLWLREVRHTSDAYDPKAVSIGPYHHYGKPELQFCQQAKHKTLEMFVDGSNRDVEFFKNRVGREVEYARSCYVDGSTDMFTNEEFAEMMLLDACFLLYLMAVTDKTNGEHYDLDILVSTLAYQDVYLLENQIPFSILTLLITSRYDERNGEDKLVHSLLDIWANSKDEEKQEIVKKIRDDHRKNPPLHLLEAYHRVLVLDFVPDPQNESNSNVSDTGSHWKTFRSATALKAKGIYFRRSEKRSLKSISFKSYTFRGQLELPVWFVSSDSKVFFPNMIAYELCPCNLNVRKTATSYLTFMKSLIEKAADVKELREKRILLTSLGSDDDVVEFYRKLDTFEIGLLDSFREAKKGIQEHYDSKMKTWIAELIHARLSSPWSFIAWLAAIALLIMTFLQTYFTIITK